MGRHEEVARIPVVRHWGLLALVLAVHVAWLAWMLLVPAVVVVGGIEPPGVLQVSIVDAQKPAPPAAPEPDAKPKPLPMIAKPIALAHPQHRPLLAVPAQSPDSPHGSDTVPRDQPEPSRDATAVSADIPTTPVLAGATLSGAQAAVAAPSFDADYLSNPAPEYPALSRQRHEQGRVLLRVHVLADGHPDQVLLHESSGFSRLDQAALEVVPRWRFVPAQAGGVDVAGWVVVPIRFSLRN